MNVPTIDEYPTLAASLGKAGCDRIRYHQNEGKSFGGFRERYVQNPHRELMQDIVPLTHGPIDDILSGIANLGCGTEKSLSSNRLHVMLQSTNRISTGLLETCLAVDSRQARRYMAAIKLAIYHITRHTNKV